MNGGFAALQLGEAPNQREPDAEAPRCSIERCLALIKHLENPGHRLGADTDPFITHDDRHRLRIRYDRDRDALMRWRVFDGIRQQVREHLVQPRHVRMHPAGLEAQLEFVIGQDASVAQHAHDLLHRLRHADRLTLQPDLSCRHPARVKQVVDDTTHMIQLPRDDLSWPSAPRIVAHDVVHHT